MSDFRLDSQAAQDVSYIYRYIAAHNLQAAESWRNELIELLILLGKSPYMGERRPELAKDLRSISLGSYVVYFRPAHDAVHVVRIVHGARDIRKIFRNRSN